MLNFNRKIITRDGRAAHILCQDFKGSGASELSIVARIIEFSGVERICFFRPDGMHMPQQTMLDLINPAIEVERYMQLRASTTLGDGTYHFVDNVPANPNSDCRAVKVRITVIPD